MNQPPEFMFDVARGDIGVARRLRKSLERIKASPMAADPRVRNALEDVLSGKMSVREFGRSSTFANLLDQIPKQKLDDVLNQSEQQRERLAKQGEADLERLRSEEPQRPDQPASGSPEQEGRRPEASPPSAPPSASAPLIPGTRKPNRDQIFTPDEPDEDDLYFQERRNRGWLE
ncbi:hypothetical protein [Nocardia cyriacigeorgica]|uniref:Uncharacterized protein n=1 Tax=Nocardia cyriacigeorgica (strain GUH-2) TaxID=1127134 RepID=H6R8J6_NOCCG|nr:hypothetical protein [Nocardia cyriacigeorgica]MBF6289355.1 hypothetical protein [Nocardia cyriacigeorgica]CCF66143.1 protein of unknown function [Nocardia cyriacigeorgica GUH-2]